MSAQEPSLAEIIGTINPYLSRADLMIDEYEKAFGNQEIEIKLSIQSLSDVSYVLEKLSTLGLGKAEHRSEQHSIYALPHGAHLSYIDIEGDDRKWMKIKTKNTSSRTPEYKLPIVFRTSMKLDASEPKYFAYSQLVQEQQPFAEFNKECINFFFLFQKQVYSLSFSLAWNERSFRRYEMEFEYEGHLADGNDLSLEDAKHSLELMLHALLPPRLLRRLHPNTKYEMLKAMS
jgi:hypothetical protein